MIIIIKIFSTKRIFRNKKMSEYTYELSEWENDFFDKDWIRFKEIRMLKTNIDIIKNKLINGKTHCIRELSKLIQNKEYSLEIINDINIYHKIILSFDEKIILSFDEIENKIVTKNQKFEINDGIQSLINIYDALTLYTNLPIINLFSINRIYNNGNIVNIYIYNED